MHRQQMTHVTAHNDVRFAGGGKCQVLVVFRVAALAYDFRRFDALGHDFDDIDFDDEESLPSLHGSVGFP